LKAVVAECPGVVPGQAILLQNRTVWYCFEQCSELNVGYVVVMGAGKQPAGGNHHRRHPLLERARRAQVPVAVSPAGDQIGVVSEIGK
jgi:hypothetical protein